MLFRTGLTVVLALLLWVSPASARLDSVSATGFSVSYEAEVKASPKDAYEKFLQIGDWWDMAHSYSGDGKRMTLDAKPGGMWLETLANGGFVRHMEVAQAHPNAMLLLQGGLGPLGFMAVQGAMTVKFDKTDNGTRVKLVYAVGGFDPDNFQKISKGVDGVLNSQFARYVEHAGK